MTHLARRALALLAGTGLTLWGCTGGHEEKTPDATASHAGGNLVVTLNAGTVSEIGLTLTRAEVTTLVGTMTIPATLLPDQDLEAQVGSLVQGRVRQVFVRVGDVVREGQVLLHIEGLEVGEIKSSFIKAKAGVQYAEANYERQKTLLDQNVGSQKVLLDARAEYNKALADFQAADKRIHSVGLKDEDVSTYVEQGGRQENDHSGGVLPIKAPIAGTVIERNVVIGQLVDASTNAFRIVNASTLWADGQVYEQDLPRLTGKPEVTLTVTAFPHEAFHGRVIYISPLVDEHTRTITIRAAIPNPRGRLKPQMFGELHVPIGGTARGLIIPAEAVQKDNAGTYAFVATTDTTFERRGIMIGTTFDSMVEVKTGIAPGERVVTHGSFQLKSELMKEALEGGE